MHTNSPWACVIKVCLNGGVTYIIGEIQDFHSHGKSWKKVVMESYGKVMENSKKFRISWKSVCQEKCYGKVMEISCPNPPIPPNTVKLEMFTDINVCEFVILKVFALLKFAILGLPKVNFVFPQNNVPLLILLIGYIRWLVLFMHIYSL